MIRYFAGKAAAYIVRNDPSADYEVLEYGYDVLFQEAGVTILTLLLALPLGLFFHIAVSLAAYNILRLCAGGIHANHRVVCVLTSIVIMFGPSVIFGKLGVTLPLIAIPSLYVAGVVMLLFYAPADTETKPIQYLPTRKRMKIISIAWLSVLYAAAFALHGRFPDYSAVLAVMPFIVKSILMKAALAN